MSAQIWAGWRHLQCAQPLDDPALAGKAMDMAEMGAPARDLLKVLYARAPHLLSVAAQATLPERAPPMSPTLPDVLEELRTRLPASDGFALRRRLLEVIDAGNRVGRFQLRIPYLPAPPPAPPPSPFTHKRFSALCAQQPLIEAYVASLAQSPVPTPEAWWGRCVFAAALGGLVRVRLLLALPAALADARSDPLRRWLWIDPPRRRADAPSEAVRWFPDPLTRLLLLNPKDPPPALPPVTRRDAQALMRQLRAYARVAGFVDRMPCGWRAFIEPIVTGQHLHAPGWLMAVATGTLDNTSLPEAAWQRLIAPKTTLMLNPETTAVQTDAPVAAGGDDGQALPGNAAAANSVPSPVVPTHRASAVAALAGPEDWPLQLRRLASVIRRPEPHLRERIHAWLQSDEATRLPSVQRIAQWIADGRLVHRRGARIPKPATIYQQLRAVSALAGLLGSLDPAAITDEEAFVELYETVLDDVASTRVRRRSATALRAFHAYLVRSHGCPRMDDSVFRIGGRAHASVDANLVSQHDFERVIATLPRLSSYDTTLNEALTLIAILGFYAGLRRSEAVGLTLGALEANPGRKPCYLMLIPNWLRGLKSRASERCLPLHLLLPSKHLRRLMRWWEKRQQAVGSVRPWQEAPLFPAFVAQDRVQTHDPRLALIRTCLSALTHDQSLRFHHLRHSFANRMVVAFALADATTVHEPAATPDDLLPPSPIRTQHLLPDWLMPTEADRQWWGDACYLRRELLGSAPTQRRALMQVAALLGHASVEVTVASYVHLADLLTARALRRQCPSLPLDTLRARSGYQETRLRALGFGTATAADLLDAVATQMAQRYRAVTSPTVTGSPPRRVVMPDEPLARAGVILEALAKEGFTFTPGLAATLSMDDDALIRVSKRLVRLPNGLARRDGQAHTVRSRRLSLPSGPKEEALMHHVYQRMEALCTHGDGEVKARMTQRRVCSVADALRAGWVPGSVLSVICPTVKAARDWRWWLTQLGIDDGIVVTHHAATHDRKGPTAGQQAKHWQESLAVAVRMGTAVADLPWRPVGEVPSRGMVTISVALARGASWTLGNTTVGRADLLAAIRVALAMMMMVDQFGLGSVLGTVTIEPTDHLPI